MGNTITLTGKIKFEPEDKTTNINHNHHGKNGHDIIRW
jgi:hypothetical protein